MAVEFNQGEQWYTLLRGLGFAFPADTQWTSALPKVFAGSEFVERTLIREPQLFITLFHSGDLQRNYVTGELAQLLQNNLITVQDEPQLHIELRRFRRRHMVRIIWRDLAGWATVDETLEDLSALADACIIQTLNLLHTWLERDLGYPEDANGTQQRLLILGMGKLGARELNMSSDIDLIFAFPSQGTVRAPTGRPSSLTNEQFFQRLAQRLIHALHHQSAEGFVFRVDTRLRPFGEAGPLVFSLHALENYYQTQARDWERYAMVKARPLTGDPETINQLMEIIRPFVYRRYLDYVAIESLREMKRLITKEMLRKGREGDIKLGPGGIREIEFIGQVFQIIRGGREPQLQIRPILTVLALLETQGLLPTTVVTELTYAYRLLRVVENRLQAWRDQQTHVLPEDTIGQQRLAHSMGYPDWRSFAAFLTRHRQLVQHHFDTIFAVPPEEAPNTPYYDLWHGTLEPNHAEAMLATNGFTAPKATLQHLQTFRESSACRTLGSRGRVRLDQLLPKLLESVSSHTNPDLLLERLLRLLEAIAKRTAYLALLVESHTALTQLIRLTAESPWIASQLAQHPLLLDELLDPRRLYAPQRHRDLLAERDSLLRAVPHDDQEQQMERLRQFTQSNRLRVAAADLTGAIPLMVVSDYLTDLAEVTLDTALNQCWDYLTGRHGKPSGLVGNNTGFAIIGYGKLGGIELGYGSDLDLVFLHGNQDHQGQTGGLHPLANDTFYGRLAQRLIHILNTRTPSGIVYEIDIRLRPNGNAGLLVSTLEAFSHYQTRSAWTWEHQALLRARPIAGDPIVRSQFRAIRLAVLTKERDYERLRTEVRDMREKMRVQLDRSKSALFDLKQGRGGIADIEFMVQYQVLRWAAQYPDLLDWTDTIRWLETLARHSLLPDKAATTLADSYRALRGAAHRLTLQNEIGLIPDERLQAERTQVQEIWQAYLVDG